MPFVRYIFDRWPRMTAYRRHWSKRSRWMREECEIDVRQWMTRCVQALGPSTIRWTKLSTARLRARYGPDDDDGAVDAVVESLILALA